VKGAEQAFQELQALYEKVAGSKTYNVSKKLSAPLEFESTTVSLTPLEYAYQAKSDGGSKTVAVTSPLKWVLSYSNFPPSRIAELLASRNRDEAELRQFISSLLRAPCRHFEAERAIADPGCAPVSGRQ